MSSDNLHDKPQLPGNPMIVYKIYALPIIIFGSFFFLQIYTLQVPEYTNSIIIM